jgi:hypothetical protein
MKKIQLLMILAAVFLNFPVFASCEGPITQQSVDKARSTLASIHDPTFRSAQLFDKDPTQLLGVTTLLNAARILGGPRSTKVEELREIIGIGNQENERGGFNLAIDGMTQKPYFETLRKYLAAKNIPATLNLIENYPSDADDPAFAINFRSLQRAQAGSQDPELSLLSVGFTNKSTQVAHVIREPILVLTNPDDLTQIQVIDSRDPNQRKTVRLRRINGIGGHPDTLELVGYEVPGLPDSKDLLAFVSAVIQIHRP